MNYKGSIVNSGLGSAPLSNTSPGDHVRELLLKLVLAASIVGKLRVAVLPEQGIL